MKILMTLQVERLTIPLTQTFNFQVASIVYDQGGGVSIYTLEQPQVHDIFTLNGERYFIKSVAPAKLGKQDVSRSVADRL